MTEKQKIEILHFDCCWKSNFYPKWSIFSKYIVVTVILDPCLQYDNYVYCTFHIIVFLCYEKKCPCLCHLLLQPCFLLEYATCEQDASQLIVLQCGIIIFSVSPYCSVKRFHFTTMLLLKMLCNGTPAALLIKECATVHLLYVLYL